MKGFPMRRGGRILGLALLALGALVAPAHADLCADCPQPTEADLASDPSFELLERPWIPGPIRDTLEVDGGACRIELEGEPTVEVVSRFLALRGEGVAWNCPHSKACDTFTVSSSESDTTEWSLAGEASISASPLGIGLSAKLISKVSEGTTVTRSVSQSKQICPGYCRVISWRAYVVVANYRTQVDYTVLRTYAWWTKNVTTGSQVHCQGEYEMVCGSGTATLVCKGPLTITWRLYEFGCSDPLCAVGPSRDLGWFPPLVPDTPLPRDPWPPTYPFPDDDAGEPADDKPAGTTTGSQDE